MGFHIEASFRTIRGASRHVTALVQRGMSKGPSPSAWKSWRRRSEWDGALNIRGLRSMGVAELPYNKPSLTDIMHLPKIIFMSL